MEPKPQRHCPRCGAPVARRAVNCLTCGALLKEQKRKRVGLPSGDLLLPLLLVVAIAAVWIWKPWQVRGGQSQALVTSTARPSPTPSSTPTQTYAVAPTATPLNTPTPSPTPTLPPNETVHTVQSGEVITTIAKKYGTTASAILRANNLKATSIIKPGQQLKIPLPVADTPTPTPTIMPSPTPIIHVVKAGETLGEIASRFKTTTQALMQANNITDPTRVHVGARLVIMRPEEIPQATPTQAAVYEVQPNDTLLGIAAKMGVSVDQLKKANGLTGTLIRIGQQLKVPGGAAGAVAVASATPEPSPTPVPASDAAPVLTDTLAPSQTLPTTSTLPGLVVTLTPTPGPTDRPVELLTPPDGAIFEGRDASVRLSWASIGILDDDEWYVVRLRQTQAEGGEEGPLLIWTKATSWRVPSDLYVADSGPPQRWRWRILIMRQTGVADDGSWIGEEVRSPSMTRVFYWK